MELLAVIVILGVLLLIAVPAVSTIIDQSREKAFYVSVHSVVKSVAYSNIDSSDCYVETEDLKNKIDLNGQIGNIKIYIYNDSTSNKKMYAVSASSKDSKYQLTMLDFPVSGFDVNNIVNDEEFGDLVLRFADITTNNKKCNV